MQPHPPQLPHEGTHRPVPKNLKSGAYWALLAVAIMAAALAFLLPKRQAKSSDALPPQEHRAQSPAYSHPNPL